MKGQPFCSSPLTLWLNAAAGPATAPMFPRLPPASLTPGASVSQISQGSILVLASAGHPHCQLDATRTRHETHPCEFSWCLWFQLILVLPHSAPIIPSWLYLARGLKVPPQMWRIKPHRDCLSTPAPTIKWDQFPVTNLFLSLFLIWLNLQTWKIPYPMIKATLVIYGMHRQHRQHGDSMTFRSL